MNFMAVSSSSLGLALHFNPKRGGAKAQQTVIWAMKLAQKTSILYKWLYLLKDYRHLSSCLWLYSQQQ
jgi:hypothetical protein